VEVKNRIKVVRKKEIELTISIQEEIKEVVKKERKEVVLLKNK